MPTKRPEHTGPAELFYDETEARKYTRNTRIVEIQSACAERALELLALPEDQKCFLLDLGCGSGLSGEVLDEHGHYWTGLDISPAMLDIAKEREVEGDVMLGDLGSGLPFQPGSFDGAISISTIQWLCNADRSSCNPVQRLSKFFSSLYGCLSRGSRAVFQFYPENSDQADLIVTQATRAGFNGGLVVDYPNSSKAKKIYLVLMTGGNAPLPQGLGEVSKSQQLMSRRERVKKHKNKKTNRERVLQIKERWRRRDPNYVNPDTKYTGRKRRHGF